MKFIDETVDVLFSKIKVPINKYIIYKKKTDLTVRDKMNKLIFQLA